MSNTDLAHTVNSFMLANAPTLTEATPMSYDLLKALASQLIFRVKTTKEHAAYVMGKQYSHIYPPATLMLIAESAISDEQESRLRSAQRRRELKRSIVPQPRLLHA